jgi:hypothetical protein
VLTFPTTTVLLSLFDFNSFIACIMKLNALTLGISKLKHVISSWCMISFFSLKRPFLSLLTKFEIHWVWYKYCFSCLFYGAISLVNVLSDFCPKLVCISVNKVGLL